MSCLASLAKEPNEQAGATNKLKRMEHNTSILNTVMTYY